MEWVSLLSEVNAILAEEKLPYFIHWVFFKTTINIKWHQHSFRRWLIEYIFETAFKTSSRNLHKEKCLLKGYSDVVLCN